MSTDNASFKDANFVVIGGAGGIGCAIAERLVAAGAHVTITSRDGARANEAAGELGAAHAHELDATDFTQTRDVLRSIDGLNGVVNCAGSILLKPAHLTTPGEFAETIATNLTTAFSVVSAAGDIMKQDGSILLFATAASEHGIPNHEAIAAAKGGVAALTRSAASTYAPRGLRFNAIAPGLVRTPLAQRIVSNERSLEASRAMHAVGRIGEPDDVARVAMTFLDPSASWLTGQVLAVDGGLSSLIAR